MPKTMVLPGVPTQAQLATHEVRQLLLSRLAVEEDSSHRPCETE
jgi:hypothetical protein